MTESFAASEDLGFIALGLPDGGEVWLAAASVYAVEKHPNEEFSMVKTVGEALGVVQSPKEVFTAIQQMQIETEKRAEQVEVDKFVKHVLENDRKVDIYEDPPISLYESEPRAKGIRLFRDIPTQKPDIMSDGTEVRVTALPANFGRNPDDVDDVLRNLGWTQAQIDDHHRRLAEEEVDEALENEFGSDLVDGIKDARLQGRPEDPEEQS